MKKLKYLIPVIILAVLVFAAVLMEKSRLNAEEAMNSEAAATTLAAGTAAAQATGGTAAQTTGGTAVQVTGGTAVQVTGGTAVQVTGGVQTAGTPAADAAAGASSRTGGGVTSQTAVRQDSGDDSVTIDGVVVNRKKLIDNLDKMTDGTINYVYNQSPDNIVIGNIYEGDYTGSGKAELLVIFKLLNMPHAGGLDSSVAAVYDRDTYSLISQKTFPYDECRFAALKDSKQRGYLLFVGSTTYQGHSQYTLLLYRPGRTWEKVYSAEPPEISELLDDPDNIKFELKDDGIVWVYRPVSFDNDTQEFKWKHEYDLIWNSDKCTLEKTDTLQKTVE